MLIEVTHVFRNADDKIIKERVLVGLEQIMMITPVSDGEHSRIIFSDRNIDIEESITQVRDALIRAARL